MALPKLVVFDLDACCWYPEMYMVRRGPPFKKEDKPQPKSKKPRNLFNSPGGCKFGKKCRFLHVKQN